MTCVFLFGYLAVNVLYNTRPYVISTPLLIELLLLIWNKAEAKGCGIYFCVCALVIAWFHGGMIPLLFMIYFVGVFVDLVYKDFRRVRILSLFLLLGFCLSLCSPIGFDTWTYAITQSSAEDVWKYISEWRAGSLNLRTAFLFVATILLFMLTNGVRRFERASILKAAYACMFAILFFKYMRFLPLLATAFMFITPEVFDVFIVWLYKKFYIVKRACAIGRLSKFFKNYKLWLSKLLLSAAALLTVANFVLGGVVFSVLPNNDLNDIAMMSGETPEIVQFIKEKGYNRLYNGYNEGTWLLFNDIKVSQDNRCDLYLEQFSGQQYINMLDNFQALNLWVNKYHPDALLLNYTVMDEERDVMPDSILVFTEYQKDKYELVFETTTKTRPYLMFEEEAGAGDADYKTIRWFIFEVKENESDEEL